MPEFWDPQHNAFVEKPFGNHANLGGLFVTQNRTDDPRYPAGSTYTSIGTPGNGNHITGIFDPAGNLIDRIGHIG